MVDFSVVVTGVGVFIGILTLAMLAAIAAEIALNE